MNLIRITRRIPGNSVSATIPFEAPQGLGVQFDPTDPTAFKKATATRGFILTRDATTEGATLTDHVFSNTLLSPVKVGSEASAEQVQEAEIEGDGLILLSGTGEISSGTAADTALGYVSGKLRVKQSADELAGYLRAQLTPEDADNTVRIRVEFVG